MNRQDIENIISDVEKGDLSKEEAFIAILYAIRDQSLVNISDKEAAHRILFLASFLASSEDYKHLRIAANEDAFYGEGWTRPSIEKINSAVEKRLNKAIEYTNE